MDGEPPSTKMRVLLACRQLFNERGVANATTAEIAATVGINEGNLYYYFKRKEQIVLTLFDEFEQAMERTATKGLKNPEDPHRYSRYMRGWFELMWEYRFFYRDGAALNRVAPSLRQRVKQLTDRGQQNVRRVLLDLNEVGLLRAPVAEIDRLVINSWMIATYWLDYLQSREGVEEITQAHVDWGFAQVQSLFRPYLTMPQGRPLGRMGPTTVVARAHPGKAAKKGGKVLTRREAESKGDVGDR
jgi:AcrR family transcriptional regulator